MTSAHVADPETCLRVYRETGAQEALGQLLKWQRDRACALATSMLGNQTDAEDAVQQACIKMLSRRVGFASCDQFESAVTRAVVQCAIDLMRSRRARDRRHERYAAMTPSHAEPADTVANAERDRVIREALAELPDDERIAVVLCCQDGQSVSAGAAILECPRETLRARLKRGLKRLQGALAGRGISAGITVIAAGLAATADAASDSLCARLDAVLPGPSCVSIDAAPMAAGLGAEVAALSSGALGASLLTALPLVAGVLIGTGAAMFVDTTPPALSPPVHTAHDHHTPHAAVDSGTATSEENPMKALTIAAAALAATTAAHAGEKVPVADLPAAVVAAVTTQEGAVIVEAEREEEDGTVVYEVEVKVGEAEWEYEVTAEGKVLEVTKEVAVADIPAAVSAKAQAAVPGLVITEAEQSIKGDEVEWELEGTDAHGTKVEVEIDGDEVEVERGDDDDKHEGHEGHKGHEGHGAHEGHEGHKGHDHKHEH